MDSNYIDLHLVVDRYLQGTLTEGEKAEFEERLVWDQALIDELDLAERLRDGLREATREYSYPLRTDSTGIGNWLLSQFSVPQFAAAASFLIAVTLTAGVLLNPFSPDRDSDGFDATPTEIIPLLVVRGTTASPVVFDAGSQLVLLVDVVGAHDSYSVTVRQDVAGAEVFWTQDEMLPSYLDSLAIGMPGSKLRAGRYVLTVEGVTVSEAGEKAYEHIQDIPFESAPAE